MPVPRHRCARFEQRPRLPHELRERGLEVTRFGGRCWGGRKKEVPNAKNPSTVGAGVSAPIVELARSGRPIAQLAREFEASANAIRKLVRQAGLGEGLRSDGLTTSEREELNRLRRENRVLREEREILAKSRGLVRDGDRLAAVTAFVSANQAMYAIATMCRVLVSASGYYAWLKRPPCARARTDAELISRIRAIHQYSRQTYGAPRIHEELLAAGIHARCKRVARLMKAARLSGGLRFRRHLACPLPPRRELNSKSGDLLIVAPAPAG